MGIFKLFSDICDKCGYSEKVNYHDIAENANEKPGEFIDRFDIKAKPGDIVQFKLSHYFHWAIFTDKGYVIHGKEEGLIVEELLIKVALGFRCRVNNLVQEANERGLKARPVSDILKEAHGDINRKYLSMTDSQMLVTKWKYGQSFVTKVIIM